MTIRIFWQYLVHGLYPAGYPKFPMDYYTHSMSVFKTSLFHDDRYLINVPRGTLYLEGVIDPDDGFCFQL